MMCCKFGLNVIQVSKLLIIATVNIKIIGLHADRQ